MLFVTSPHESRKCIVIPDTSAALRTKGRHGTKYTEEMEDQALLADEDTGGERAGHRLSVQPSVIKGGQMRKYQMEGLN